MTRVIGPHEFTADEVKVTVAGALIQAKRRGMDRSWAVVDALADLTGTHREGLARALTLFRSNLCGAADVLPHVEAERDRLKVLLTATLDAIDGHCGVDHDAAGCLCKLSEQIRRKVRKGATWCRRCRIRRWRSGWPVTRRWRLRSRRCRPPG